MKRRAPDDVAVRSRSMDNSCLFCRMVRGELKPDVVYEDDAVLAFRDIQPQAPVHVLVIPKEHVAGTDDLGPGHGGLIGSVFLAAAEVARREGVAESGYRLVTNCRGDAGQSVFHLHVHVLGGRAMGWPPF